jgi:hypothetical protein
MESVCRRYIRIIWAGKKRFMLKFLEDKRS